VSEPRVSVVIPTYNWSSALNLSLQSVIAQTLHDIEIIVVGDGCTDDSESVVKKFNDHRVRWIHLNNNSGSQSVPNNRGIQEAKSEFIAYLGHDDIWHPTHLETLLTTQREKNADYIFSGMILYGPPDTGIRSVAGLPIKNILQRNNFIPPSTVMHKKNMISRIGGWKDPHTVGYPVDYEFQLRAWDHGEIFANTGQITAFKFPAAWWRDSYKKRDVSRQLLLLKKMQSDINFIENEIIAVARAINNHLFHVSDVIKPAEKGHYFSVNRLIRGIKDPQHAGKISENSLLFTMNIDCHAFEWHELEKNQNEFFRWTGPRSESVVDIPYCVLSDLIMKIHIVYAINNSTLNNLRILINHYSIKFNMAAHPKQGWLLTAKIPYTVANAGAKNNIRLQFKVPKTFSPFTLTANPFDRRYLGVAVGDIKVKNTWSFLRFLHKYRMIF